MNDMKNKEQKTVSGVYAAVTAVFILTFVPMISAAVIALVAFLAVFFALYFVKGRAEADSLCENHMVYLIRTFWIAGLVGAVSITLASFYLLPNMDQTLLQPCLQGIVNSGATDGAAMQRLLQPCVDEFVSANKGVLLTGAIIGALPLTAYFAWRLFKGLTRALKGYRMPNPKSWL